MRLSEPMPRILLVDDSAAVRRLVAARLSAENHDVIEVASGEDAIARALSEPFDLVVSDVRMGAITGVQLCRVLRSDPITADLPVVLLSASHDPRSRFWGRHAGANAYLAKESMLEQLVPTVATLLEGREARRAGPARKGVIDAATRVSEVMDRHLFEAVVAAEARRLMEHLEDRDAFVDAAASLLHDVVGAPYASLVVLGTEGPTSAIVARAPFPLEPTEEVLEALGLPPSRRSPHVTRAASCDPSDDAFEPGMTEAFDLVVKEEVVGTLRIHGGAKRLSSDDRRTATLLADVLAPVVKSILLVEETRRLAQTDGLTGLANRRAMTSRLEHEHVRGRRYKHPFSVVMIDVDHFKAVNDRYGHGVGDTVLVVIARALERSVRSVDLAGRWGGEEFVVLLPECDLEGARVVAERVRTTVEAIPAFEGGPDRVTVSCGVAASSSEASSGMALMALADAALYRAKREGRNRVVLHEE